MKCRRGVVQCLDPQSSTTYFVYDFSSFVIENRVPLRTLPHIAHTNFVPGLSRCSVYSLQTSV